jgi:prophage tail gpP-like protein
MTLQVKVNGLVYENFIQADVDISMESLSGSFSFTSTITKTSLFPVKKGDKVEVIADGVTTMTGFVEKISVSYSATDHKITLNGRSTLCDLIDSSIVKTHEFSKEVTLVKIIRTILDDLGMTSVQIIDKTGGVIAPFKSTEIASAVIGDKAFTFIESYARKRQVLLNDDGSGNIMMTRASTEVFPATLNNNASDFTLNNILSASFSFDDSQRFKNYTAYGQLNPVALEIGSPPKTASRQKGVAIDDEMRSTRQLVFNCEESSDDVTAQDRSTWEANVRRAKSLSYQATVQGHSLDGRIWQPNVKIMVVDDFCGISCRLLVRSVKMSYSLDSGSITTLDMTYEDAFILQASVTSQAKETKKIGTGLTI